MTSSALNNHARITTHNQPFDLRQACPCTFLIIWHRSKIRRLDRRLGISIY